MARVSAYGDITITDLTDVGRITSYLTSSLPLTVLYNPNQTPSYNPNWETTNLVLTPTIMHRLELDMTGNYTLRMRIFLGLLILRMVVLGDGR